MSFQQFPTPYISNRERVRFLASLIVKLDYSEKNPWGNKKDSDDDDGPSLAVNSKAGLGRAAFFLDTALLYTSD